MIVEPLLVRTLRGERQERTPVWFMRQAGRFLPEYRAIRAKHRMLDVIRTPELACEVTMQPLQRFDLDAAIVFADILTPLMGMGVSLDFKEHEGPCIENTVRNERDVRALRVPEPEENVGYTLEAIRLLTAELAPRKIPLIGFSGAPFTLSAYLIEGGRLSDLKLTKQFMLAQPQAWHELQEKLVKLVSEYLKAQVQAGARVVQIFDSWLGCLSPSQYDWAVAPYLKRIVDELRSASAPVIFFATGVTGLLPQLAELNATAYGVDWRVSLSQASKLLGRTCALQGNLDPQLLTGPWERVSREAQQILAEGRNLCAHVFNLGHGILPDTPIENVERLIALVREQP